MEKHPGPVTSPMPAHCNDLSEPKNNRLSWIRKFLPRPIGDQAKPSVLSENQAVPCNPPLNRKHTPGYQSWAQMKQRCKNPNNESFALYGARGITYSPHWEDFAAFIADMGQPTQDQSLDRIDPRGNYEPGNCRWATKKEQARNRISNRFVEFRGSSVPLAELAERYNIAQSTLAQRLDRGMGVEDAISEPVLRGGDRRAQREKRIGANGFDRWPKGMKPGGEEHYEAKYQRSGARSQGVSRPAFFLNETESLYNDLIWDLPEGLGSENDERVSRAGRLSDLRNQAFLLKQSIDRQRNSIRPDF